MNIIIDIFFYLSFFIYNLILIFFLIGFIKYLLSNKTTLNKKLKVSVVVAAKDEEENIGNLIQSLLKQTIDVEIIIVNDRSEDSTGKILDKYKNIIVIDINEIEEGVSPKKNALSKGIKKATGDIILLTDADCVVKNNWAEKMRNYFKTDISVVSGLSFLKESNIFHKILNLEYFLFGICTAAANSWNYPVISTGNNFSYRKKLFNLVNGFKSILKIDSGDDDLLIQKFSNVVDNVKFSFADDPDTYVMTEPVNSFKEFVNQRKRWASRGLDYKSLITLMLFFVYIYFCFQLLIPIFVFFNMFFLKYFIISFIIEIFLLIVGLSKFGKLKYIIYYPVARILYIPYIVIIPFLGIVRGFNWK